MKGLIVNCRISDGLMGHIHGAHRRINRLVIPERMDLTITPYRGNVYVWKDKGVKGARIAEVEVPDDIIEQAEALFKAHVHLGVRLHDSPVFSEYFGDQ